MEGEKGDSPHLPGPTFGRCPPSGFAQMGTVPFFPWTGALWLVLLAMAQAGCCQDGQKPCNDITPGAIPQPNGTYACQWIHGQMARADQDNFVIYQYEWSADATQAEATKLTPFGQEHLARIALGLCQVPFPVVIEPSSDQRVDESRRLAVLEALAYNRVPIMPDRVILGRPEAEGLYGQEAPGVARGMLGTSSGGQGTGATGGGATGSNLGGVSTSGGAGLGVGIGVGVGSNLY